MGFFDGGFGALLGGLAGIGSAASSAKAQRDATKAQKEMQEKEMAFNAAEAEKQRAWEQKNANTEYQRTIRDMRLAGINPMLAAFSGSTNSTPSGSAASVSLQGGPYDIGAKGMAQGLDQVMQGLQFALDAQNSESERDLNAVKMTEIGSSAKLADARSGQIEQAKRLEAIQHQYDFDETTTRAFDDLARRWAMTGIEPDALDKTLRKAVETSFPEIPGFTPGDKMDALKKGLESYKNMYQAQIRQGKYMPYIDMAKKSASVVGDFLNGSSAGSKKAASKAVGYGTNRMNYNFKRRNKPRKP